MFSKDQARTIVGIIGNIISLVLFMSPATTFYGIWRKKTVGEFSPLPYLATFVNCALWVLYGLPMVHPKSIPVITINGTGLVIEVVFLSIFLIYNTDRKKRLKMVAILVVELIFVTALAVSVLTLVHTTKQRSTIVGSMGVVGNILMYAAPLSVMKMVIQTKSVEYMPFSLSLFSFLNGVCWTTYALLHFDPFLVIPNGLGTAFALAQLILYASFYGSTKRIMAQRKEKEVGLTTVSRNGNVLQV